MMLSSSMAREAAGLTTQIGGEVIPSDNPVESPWRCANRQAWEQCPRTHGLIVQAFVEAGLDGGIVNLITNAPQYAADVVGAMIHHPAVRRVNFTGSTAVGKIIAKRCAENLKPVILELGGKAPLIVLEDADLDEAVKAAAFCAFMNQGQIGPTVHDEAQMPLRRRQGIRLWQVRRQGGDRQLHRTALDHHENRAGPLSHLILNSRIFSSCA
jgi:hypothetical protein